MLKALYSVHLTSRLSKEVIMSRPSFMTREQIISAILSVATINVRPNSESEWIGVCVKEPMTSQVLLMFTLSLGVQPGYDLVVQVEDAFSDVIFSQFYLRDIVSIDGDSSEITIKSAMSNVATMSLVINLDTGLIKMCAPVLSPTAYQIEYGDLNA